MNIEGLSMSSISSESGVVLGEVREPLKHGLLSLSASPSLPKDLRRELRNSGVIPDSVSAVEGLEELLDLSLKDPELAHIFIGAGRFEIVSQGEAALWRRERLEAATTSSQQEKKSLLSYLNNALIVGGALEPAYLRDLEITSGIKVKRSLLTHFANGEIMPQLGGEIAGKDIFLVYNPDNSSNEPLMELFLQVDAARRGGAEKIIVLAPSFPYARGDRKNGDGTPISASAVINLLESQGVSRVICFDLHAGQIEGFAGIPIDNITALPLLTKAIAQQYPDTEFVVALPDEGMGKRLKDEKIRSIIVENLGPKTTFLQMAKDRIEANEINSSHIKGGKVDLSGKVVLMLDDMIDTGKTLRAGARVLLHAGAMKVLAASTQGILSGNAVESFRDDYESLGGKLVRPISEIYVTSAIDLRRGKGDLLRSVSISEMLGEIVRSVALRDGRSLRDIMLNHSSLRVV